LAEKETEALFNTIRLLKAKGMGIIYISHRLEEIKEIGDRVTVLRDGHRIRTLSVAEASIDELITLMVGRELKDQFPRHRRPPGEVALELRAPAWLPPALGDPRAIQEAVGHLLDNAIEASPRGGKVELSVAAVDGAALRLCVADAGPGIAPADRQRVFDPLFGTKGQAGMGLTTCHRIVEAHHGSIRVDGEPGAGARVTIILPAAPAVAHLA